MENVYICKKRRFKRTILQFSDGKFFNYVQEEESIIWFVMFGMLASMVNKKYSVLIITTTV